MMVLTNIITCSAVVQDVVPVMKFEKFSSWAKLMRVLSYEFRFMLALKKSLDEPGLSARVYLLTLVQSLFLSKEKTFLLNPANHEVPPLLANLDLFLNDRGLVRSSRRIGKSSLYPQDILYPVLLPRYSHITDLIIMDFHLKYKHLSNVATLSKHCLSGFWINKARHAIKSVISSCSLWNTYNAISFKYPKVTNVPKHRVNFVKLFHHTGIDFTGHLSFFNIYRVPS